MAKLIMNVTARSHPLKREAMDQACGQPSILIQFQQFGSGDIGSA
jgi:hypothetical protein